MMLRHSDNVSVCWVRVGYMLSICWVHIEYVLGTCWVHVEYILGTCWVHIEYMLGTCWVHFGYTLSTCWVHVSYLFVCLAFSSDSGGSLMISLWIRPLRSWKHFMSRSFWDNRSLSLVNLKFEETLWYK